MKIKLFTLIAISFLNLLLIGLYSYTMLTKSTYPYQMIVKDNNVCILHKVQQN